MKSFKSIFFTAVAATLVLASCTSDDDYSYAVGEKSAGAFLTSAQSSFVYTPGQEQVLTIGLGRTEYSDAGTVTLQGDNAAFQVPASVNFAAGEKEKSVDIPFTLNTGETAKLTIKVTSATSAYGADSIVVNVKCDYEWVSLGTGKYYDAFFFSQPYDVEILQCTGVPNMYRIKGPYLAAINAGDIPADPACPPTEDIDITIINKGETYADQVVDFDGLVGYDVIHSGYFHSTYGAEVYIYHPASGFKNHDTPDTWAYNKVVSYQETQSCGVNIPGQVQLAPYYYMDGVGGWNYADADIAADGGIMITFPGYVVKDYSLAFKYQGRQTDMFGLADFAYGTVTLGADVAYAKLAVATDETYDDVLDGLMAGTLEGVTVEQSGAVQLPGVNGTGYYYVIMVAFDENGETVDNDYSAFFFTSSKEQWTKLYDGVYNYGVEEVPVLSVNMSFYEGSVNGSVYKSTTTEGLYTIKPWGSTTNPNYGLVFWWDTESNAIQVQGAETGDEDIYEYEGETYNDGPVVFYTLDLLGVPVASFYDPDTKTFNFNGIYGCDAGWYGGILETFVVGDNASARRFHLAPFAKKSKHQGKKQSLTVKMKHALSPVKMEQYR